jgi:hypothetical protein
MEQFCEREQQPHREGVPFRQR